MTAILFRIVLLACSIISTAFPVIGQDRELYQQVSEKYFLHDATLIKMSVKVFSDKSKKEMLYKESVLLQKQKCNYLYIVGSSEMLFNSKYLILVDHGTKEIIFTKYDEKDRRKFEETVIASQQPIDSLFKFYGTPVVREANDAVDYVFTLKDANIRTVTVSVAREQRVYRKIEYDYADGACAVILFDEFSTTPRFSESEFSESRYLRTGPRGDVEPATKLNGYKLVRRS